MAYSVLQVANELIKRNNARENDPLTNLKLQKLLYYQQGFHLAYFGTPLFDEDIEAWMYGPVCPVAYSKYEQYGRAGLIENTDDFSFTQANESAMFDEVLKVYGRYSAIGLMELTHSEMPWKTTPVGRGNVISLEKMRTFFKKRLK